MDLECNRVCGISFVHLFLRDVLPEDLVAAVFELNQSLTKSILEMHAQIIFLIK